MEEGPQSLDERNDEGQKMLNDGMVWETATKIQDLPNSKMKPHLYLFRHIEAVAQNRTECSFMFPIAVQCSYQLQDQILNVLCGKITHRHSLHCFLMVSLDTELGVAYLCQPIILCLFH